MSGRVQQPTPSARPLPNTPTAPGPRELPWPARQLNTAALGRRGQQRVWRGPQGKMGLGRGWGPLKEITTLSSLSLTTGTASQPLTCERLAHCRSEPLGEEVREWPWQATQASSRPR